MSDDAVIGKTCGMPTRQYIKYVCIAMLAWGLFSAAWSTWNALNLMVNDMQHAHCHGQGCDDTLSCNATVQASHLVRYTTTVLGCIYFGIQGLIAIQNVYADKAYAVACWFLAIVIINAVTVVWDTGYFFLCDYHFSYNVIALSVLMPIHNFPIYNGIKMKVANMHHWPAVYTNELVGHTMPGRNLFSYLGVEPCQTIYMVRTLILCAFFAHASWVTFTMAYRFHYGMIGLGASFRIDNWQERLKLKEEASEVFYNTLEMAYEGGLDADWDRDEYMLRRALTRPHWYRGNMPNGGMAKAYDGFRDDRRNVLL